MLAQKAKNPIEAYHEFTKLDEDVPDIDSLPNKDWLRA